MSSSTLAAGLRHLRGRMAVQNRNAESDEHLLTAFTVHRDKDAFAVLVRRHGPMVLHVCRRVLGHEQDAEDAFQATFLLLARGAAGIRNKSALAGFLHGAAYRIALNAKRSAARRRKHEGCLGALTQPRSPADPTDELSWREVRALLDEELARLPEKYRCVFVLCCLEELSQAEAARCLGVNERTLSSRLNEARKRLSQRLARRGVELTAVLAAITLATRTASALPAELMAATVTSASAASAGEGVAGLVSSSVAELVHNATASMLLSKIKIAAVVLLLVATSGSLVGWFGRASGPLAATPEPPAATADDKPRAASPKRETAETVPIRGRVVDPDGKPVRGAKLVFIYNSGKKYPHKVWTVSAASGRFAFTVPVKEVDNGYSETPWQDTYVVAAAEGYGFAAARLGKPGAADLTLRLIADDKPIRGRIIDLQGKPVSGVRVRIADRLAVPKTGDLTAFLAALKAGKDHLSTVETDYLTSLYSPALDLLFPPATTGADGRFEIKGLGPERIARLRLEGPTIATQEIQAMTRARAKIEMLVEKDNPKGPSIVYHGAAFDLLAAPSRPIVGVVRAKDSGKPLAGVTIESMIIGQVLRPGFLRATTDKDGRYRLLGLPKGDDNVIAARIDDLPYLTGLREVENPLFLGPVTVDFALTRGVWVKGRITEKGTGKPLWASIHYFCFADNPRAKDIDGQGALYNRCSSREDGSFRIAVFPGHGLIAVRAKHDHYIMGAGAYQIKGPRRPGSTDAFRTTPYTCLARSFHSLIEIHPKPGVESIACAVALDPGRTVTGTVLGPDGKPLAGARASGLKDTGEKWRHDPLPDADFTVEGLLPNKSRFVQFRHDGKKLIGSLLLRGNEKSPVFVRLQQWGTLTGRLIAPDGVPLNRMRVFCYTEVKADGQIVQTAALEVPTNKDGRFHIEGLQTGVPYKLGILQVNAVHRIDGVPKTLTLKAGETKDVGERIVKPME